MSGNGKFELRSLVVCYVCNDDKLRAVEFRGKDAKQVHGYLQHIQGGHVRIKPEPLLLLNEHPEIVALVARLEKENAQSPSSSFPFIRRWVFGVRRFLRIARP